MTTHKVPKPVVASISKLETEGEIPHHSKREKSIKAVRHAVKQVLHKINPEEEDYETAICEAEK